MERKLPVVSVVIPCFNGEKYIAEAIESVLLQTYKELEVVVVDDCSEDSSKQIIRKFLREGSIKFIEHDKNKGIPSARNTGIKASSGEYIAFLDQDDLWRPGKLERQIEVFREDASEEVGLVFSDVEIWKNAGLKGARRRMKVPSNINAASHEEVLKALFLRNFIPIVTTLIRRRCFEKIGLFDETIVGGGDDYEFFLRLVPKYRIVYIRGALSVRREHSCNYTDAENIFRDNLIIIEKVLVEAPFLARLKKKKLSYLYYELGRYYQVGGQLDRAEGSFLKSLGHNPARIKSALALCLCFMGSFGNRILDGWGLLKSIFSK